MMKYGFLEDGEGHKSMGRLLALIAQMTGAVTVATGLAGFVVGLIARPEVMGHAVTLVTVGIGVEVAAGAMKNWAKSAEK